MRTLLIIKRLQAITLATALLACISPVAFAQAFADASEPIATAQAAMAKSDWASAEKALLPASQLKPANPFVYYEMARVYENTNRVEAARQIYQGLVALPDAEQRQYTMVVRNTKEQYMTTLTAQAQSRLNAIGSQPVVVARAAPAPVAPVAAVAAPAMAVNAVDADRKSTRLNSSHPSISRMPSSA